MVKKLRSLIENNNSRLELAEHASAVVLTNKQKLSLYKKSQNSGISVDILEEVYRRGHDIWNESFGGNAEKFAFDRVNSFIAGGFARQVDNDLSEKCTHIKEFVTSEKQSDDSDDPSSRFDGTTSCTNVYKKSTPGQLTTIKNVVNWKRKQK